MSALATCRKSLQDAILSGAYAAGERLPAERALAADLGVGRVTVRSALGALVTQGLLETRQGSGYVVRPMREAHAGASLLPELERLGTLSVYEMARDLLRLRRHLAAALIEHFTTMATIEMTAVRDALRSFEELVHQGATPRELALGDGRILEALVSASRSLTFELMLYPVTRVLMEVHALHPLLYAEPSSNVVAYRATIAWLEGPRKSPLPLLVILEARDEISLRKLK
ncbi:MAG: winged helix-turn-helix domain-containing protein [Polyangiales bacterium]